MLDRPEFALKGLSALCELIDVKEWTPPLRVVQFLIGTTSTVMCDRVLNRASSTR